jgi:hypothetical protein
MSLPTPNYFLIKERIVQVYNKDFITLPAGSCCRPISPCYLPKHVLEYYTSKGYDKDKNDWCYTKFGIIPIPKGLIRGD